MNLHFCHPHQLVHDQYGSYGPALCGTVGSYITTDRADVNCARCDDLATHGQFAPEHRDPNNTDDDDYDDEGISPWYTPDNGDD